MPRLTEAMARRANLALGLICLILVGAAIGLEAIFAMEPCPLCIFQRWVFVLMGVILLIGTLRPGRPLAVLAGFAALGGVALAVRHLWLQSLPADEVPACGPGLDYLLDAFPLAEAVGMVLSGSGECAEVDALFGVSLPGWTLAGYLLLGALAVVINWRSTQPALR